MKVEFVYAGAVADAIKSLYKILNEYDDKLLADIKNCSIPLTADDANREFFHNEGRNALIGKIRDLESAAIPTSVKFINDCGNITDTFRVYPTHLMDTVNI